MAQVNKDRVSAKAQALTVNPASAGGDKIKYPGSDTIIIVQNANAAPVTATIVRPGNLETGDPYPDPTVVVPAGDSAAIRLSSAYADENGDVSISWDITASVTFLVLSV